MGCVGSKIDEVQAVALCKDRYNSLSDAIQCRYRLADAHAGYTVSLRVVGDSLQKFFEGHDRNYSHHHNQQFRSHHSPILTLPTQRKGDPMPPLSPVIVSQHPTVGQHRHSRSNSGSHVHFETSDSDDDGYIHSVADSPYLQNLPTKTFMNYSKKGSAAPVVSYEIPPASPDVGYGYAFEGNPYYPYPYPYSGYGESTATINAAPSSSTQPPRSPPSPPKVSTWEFLNIFEAFTNNYPSYSPSRSSKDVREEEGIPELEDDEIEVNKEAVDDHKHVSFALPSAHTEMSSSSKAADAPEIVLEEKQQNQVVREKEKLLAEGVGPIKEEIVTKNLVPKSRAASEAVKVINQKFLGASESCDLISDALEVGKRRFRQKRYTVDSVISLLSIFKSSVRNGEPDHEEEEVESRSLSSTLQKLCIWENKLYEEVRTEEKMRQLHEQKLRLLKHLDEKGAESDKIITIQAKVKKLATRIGVAIQVIDLISQRISIIRDEELWPLLHELIQGFAKMWKALMECHKSQWEAVVESTNLDAVASGGDLAWELEFTFLRWIEQFRLWFKTQKDFARALNSWLFMIIGEKEPEITADGAAPFSPGRVGAPPVFVVCNQWAQAMERTSDVDVVEAMRAFTSSVFQVWRQRRRIDNPAVAEKQEKTINRALEALDQKLAYVENQRGVRIYREIHQPRQHLEAHSLHEGLQHVFDTIERLAGSSLKVYEDLLVFSLSERVRASAVD